MNNHPCFNRAKNFSQIKGALPKKSAHRKAAHRLLAINKSHAPHIEKIYPYHNVERSLKMIDIDREYCVKSRLTW
jgi:hypothetical protein